MSGNKMKLGIHSITAAGEEVSELSYFLKEDPSK
jgi:hypothetical protein